MRERVNSIANELLSRIESGEYDSRLPAERHLAEEFGVPRNTVRSALGLLVQRKVIGRRAGSGNFILASANESESDRTASTLQSAAVAENTGPVKLHMVRGIFEPELVRLAVGHTSPKNIDALRRIVERMELVGNDAGKFAECEESFCLQLARGTENPLLIAIYELIADVRRLSNWRAQRRKKLTPEHIGECHKRYRAIFEAIENHDASSAVEYLRLQLIDEQQTQAPEG